MQKTLINSGPLIALFDKSDKYHHKVLEFLKWIELGGITVYNISQDEISHIRVIMKKYSDIPMDLADASLMYVANREKIKTIVSIDSDFDIYRTLKNKV